MSDQTRDYARDLEEALNTPKVEHPSYVQAAGPQRQRPSVQALGGLPSGSKPNGQDRATFSTVMAANQELQKRLQVTLDKAREIQDLMLGPLNEAQGPKNDPEKERQGLSIFERLGLETMRQANDLARLDRMLDRVLGALR